MNDMILKFFLRLISSPISLHWLWPLTIAQLQMPIGAGPMTIQDQEARIRFVESKATEMCHDW